MYESIIPMTDNKPNVRVFRTIYFLTDCGSNHSIAFGYVNFTGIETTFGQSLAVICEEGYELHGDPHITCLSGGNWSNSTICKITGR